MSNELNIRVVLAALDQILEPMTTHKLTHVRIMRDRVKKLRDQVAQYVTDEGDE
jgi:hypothetical protein